MTAKKTHAQLQREINEALAGKPTSHATKRSTPRSVWGPVVGSHALGTADVRTKDGAYWIVTVPTGHRVDYKSWGPSNEVDLGTFPSRARARAKITAHAGGAENPRAHATMKKLYVVTVPPTAEVGSYTTRVRGPLPNARRDALWDYNSTRGHDGLPPVDRMPRGTKYTKEG